MVGEYGEVRWETPPPINYKANIFEYPHILCYNRLFFDNICYPQFEIQAMIEEGEMIQINPELFFLLRSDSELGEGTHKKIYEQPEIKRTG